MDQKKGLLPIIILLLFSLLVSMWVWKNVPIQSVPDVSQMKMKSADVDSLLSEGKPVLLNISSDGCPYCVIMGPHLEQIYMRYGQNAVIREINASDYPEVAMRLPVRGTPVQYFFYADGSPYEPSETVWKQMNFLYYTLESSNRHVLTAHEGMMTAEQMELVLQDMGVEV